MKVGELRFLALGWRRALDSAAVSRVVLARRGFLRERGAREVH